MMKKPRVISTVISAIFSASLLSPVALFASGCQSEGEVQPLASDCTLDCSLAGCPPGVSIRMQGFELDQAYSVDIKTAEETVQCTLPAGVDEYGVRSMKCNNMTSIAVSEEHGTPFEIRDNPIRVEITIRQGDTVVVQEDIEPTYLRSAPNGEACGPICHSAEISIQL